MIKSGETIRLEVVQEKVQRIKDELQSVESQLSFVQGDEMCETAADSVGMQLRKISGSLLTLSQWVEDALITMSEIDNEAEQRRLNRA